MHPKGGQGGRYGLYFAVCGALAERVSLCDALGLQGGETAHNGLDNLGRFLGGAGGQHLGQVCGGGIGGILVPVKHDLVAVGAGVDLAPVAISGLAVACAFERILEGPELAVGLKVIFFMVIPPGLWPCFSLPVVL